MDSLYEKLSEERKKLQEEGNMPEWWSTGGWQLYKKKYLYQAEHPREQFQRIAKTLAKHIEGKYPDWWPTGLTWEQAFFDEMWTGRLSPSTPVHSNTGTNRGMSVSCSGNYIDNSIYGIYDCRTEVSVLTKEGFGTATYLGSLSPRGTVSVRGVECSGVVPIVKGFVEDMRYTAQGTSRRGAWAGYIEIEHGDFWELIALLEAEPDDLNIGWIVTKEFKENLEAGDEESLARMRRILKVKMITGKGYFFFPEKANAKRPQMYKDLGLFVTAPQLCNEIMLHSSPELTYTCVLSSTNLMHWKTIKDNKSVFIQTVLLDCVAQDFIEKATGIKGLEKAVKFTKLGRALGLGVTAFHSYLQSNMIPFESLEAHMWNNQVFKHISEQSLEASQWMAQVLGEPEWCKGYGVRNTHRMAVAPTKSTSLLMGGVSEGINPDPAMTFTQLTAAGEVDRANPILLKLMKDRGVYDKKHMKELTEAQGSVQNVSWLTEEEKLVFKTAFEIDQMAVLRLAAGRQRYIDQGQSLNLFFSAEEDEEYISEVVKEAFDNPDILGLYYFYSKAGVTASKGECLACQ